MTAVLLDTHVWVWTWGESYRLSDAARAAIESADVVLVSPVSVFEVAQKARLGKWPEIESVAGNLLHYISGQASNEAPLTAEICSTAGWLNWAHRDPFDRLIGATAMVLNIPLISKDTAFAGLEGVRVVW